MNRQERQAVTAALCKLAMATAGQELDPKRIVVYLEQLDADPPEQVLAAITRLTRTARFFPSVGEIVAEMDSVLGDKAESAWIQVTGLTRSDWDTIHRAYDADPALRHAVGLLGGMSVIRDRTIRDERYIRERFIKAYNARAKSEAVRLSTDTRRLLS